MEIFLSGGCDDVVVVVHEDDVMNEKVIFFSTLHDCTEEQFGELLLVEPEGSVVCTADQMVWIFSLQYA